MVFAKRWLGSFGGGSPSVPSTAEADMVKTKATADKKRQKIAEAVKAYDLTGDPVWSDLDLLSTHTVLDGVEVDPEGVILEKDDSFEGVMNIYVTLHYGSGEDAFATSESFLGKYHGHFEGNRPTVDRIEVDTSPFYE
jgi:hypothetical protein